MNKSMPVGLVLILLLGSSVDAMPRHVYLTWQSDPATTMTVNIQTEEPAAVEVRYSTASGSYRHSASGSAYRL